MSNNSSIIQDQSCDVIIPETKEILIPPPSKVSKKEKSKNNNNTNRIKLYLPDDIDNYMHEIMDDATKSGEEVYDTIEELSDKYNDNELRMCERIYRLLMFFLGALFSILLMISLPMNWHVTKLLGIWLGLVFLSYFIHIYWLVFTTEKAFRIFTLNGRIPKWINMPIAHAQILYKNHPITSISELSAIGGGMTNQMLVVISVIAWTTMLVQTLNNIYFEKLLFTYVSTLLCSPCSTPHYSMTASGENLDIWCELIGSFGLLIISTNELNPASEILRTMHSIGVILGFFCPIGLLIQQIYIHKQYNNNIIGIIFSIILILIALIFFVIWTKHKKTKPIIYKNDCDKTDNEVTKHSRMNILLESIVLIAGAASLCIWLGLYDKLSNTYDNNIGNNTPHFGKMNNYFNRLFTKYGCYNKIYTPNISNNQLYCTATWQ